jgi:hypothetical protein
MFHHPAPWRSKWDLGSEVWEFDLVSSLALFPMPKPKGTNRLESANGLSTPNKNKNRPNGGLKSKVGKPPNDFAKRNAFGV